MKKAWKLLGFLVLVWMPISCTTAPPPRATWPPSTSRPAPVERRTVRHTVAPGETVWRLAKMYDVPMSEIVRVNGLSKTAPLKMGQEVIIPRAAPVRPVIPIFPSHKWRYIIIHHSATEEGDSLAFHRAHLRRGFDRGVGYHFVIDNGTEGKADGQIEATPRWIKQQDGAHCKAGNMNPRAIGICLVGNFDTDEVSRAQMAALVHLIRTLQKAYGIPDDRILGHGRVPGARTDCPGTRFPWVRLRRELRAARETDGR